MTDYSKNRKQQQSGPAGARKAKIARAKLRGLETTRANVRKRGKKDPNQ